MCDIHVGNCKCTHGRAPLGVECIGKCGKRLMPASGTAVNPDALHICQDCYRRVSIVQWTG